MILSDNEIEILLFSFSEMISSEKEIRSNIFSLSDVAFESEIKLSLLSIGILWYPKEKLFCSLYI